MLYHLAGSPALAEVEGVARRAALKAGALMVPVALWLAGPVWRRWLAVVFLAGAGASAAVAAPDDCKHAAALLKTAGVSRDAKENFLGKVKIEPPHGSFPEEMDRITWWGKFEPFELWGQPEMEAVWIAPGGREVARQKLRGKKCSLAKTAIKGADRPFGKFEAGIWEVAVQCGETPIDRRRFAVMSPVDPPAQAAGDAPGGMMIWAGDALDEKSD
jgi:hypothetical protein